MASQTPKFQYQPTIQDVWKSLSNLNEDLRNEADHPLSTEVMQAIGQLYTRDRQLEDYLSNLSSGGSTPLKSALWNATDITVPYQATGTFVQMVWDQWHTNAQTWTLNYNNGVTFGFGRYLLIFDSGLYFTSPGPSTWPTVYIEGLVNVGGSVVACPTQSIRLQTLDGTSHSDFLSDPAATLGSSTLEIIQPPGSSSVGASQNFDLKNTTLFVVQAV